MGRLDGKIAIITGGARGQGAAEAERFAVEGATVFITDVRSEEGLATAERLGEAVTDPAAGIPVGRVGTADEVANVVLFLASDESSYCSGHEFVVDGATKA